MFDLSEYDNQSWFINGIQFNSTAEARRYVEEHPELTYNFNADGKHFKSFDELVQYVKDKSKAAFDELEERDGALEHGSFDREREATQMVLKAMERFKQAIKSGNVSNIINLVTGDEIQNWNDYRRSRREEYDKLHFNDFARENMPVFFDIEDKAQKEAYRQMEQYSRNAPNTPYAGIGRGTQMAAISLRETDPQKISSDVVSALDRRGALTDYLLGRMGIHANEVPKDYNPLGGGGGSTLTGAEMNALTMLMHQEHSDMADKIQQEIYDYYKRKDAPDGDLEYILSSAVHDNLMSTIAKAMAHRAANDSGIREQLRQMAFGEYGDNAGFLTNVGATAAPFVVDMALGAFKLSALVGNMARGAVVKGIVKEGTKRLIARGATKSAARKAAESAATRWIATEHPYWNMALNALGSGVNFATYEAQNELVRQYNDGQFSLGSLLGKGAKGFLLGGATGFAGGFFGKMGENMRGWQRLGVDVAGFGSEVTIFATSDAAMQAMEGEDVNWGKAFGRSLAMVTGFKAVGGIGTIFKSPEAIYKRYAGAKDLDYKLTDADKTALSGLGYDFSTKEGLNKAIGELAPVEKTNADGTKTVDRSNYDRVMQDNSGNVDILTKRKVNRLLTGSDLIHWTGGKDYYPFNAWRKENEDGTITIQTFDADGNINGIAEYRSSWSAAKDYRDVLDMCRFYNLNGIRAFLGNAGADVTIERDAFERTRKQFADEDVSELEALLSLKKPQEEWTDRDREILDAHLQNVHDVFGEQLKEYQAKQAAAAYDGATKYEESMRAAQEQATRLLTGGTGAEGGGGVPPAEGGDGPVEQTPADKARADYERLMADVENRKRVAESGVREVFGDDVMDYLTKGDGAPGFDPIFLLRQVLVSGESDENIAKITDYINAWYADKGVRDGVNGAFRSEVEQSDAEIDGASNRQSGHVLGAVMKVDDRRVFVVDGELVLNDDGTIDREKSSESIIVKDAATGKVEVVDPRDVLEVVDGGDAAELKEAARKEIEAKAAGLPVPGDVDAADNGGLHESGQADTTGEPPADNGGQIEAGGADDAMPMIGEGEDAEPDFMQTSPERGFRYIYDESGWDQDEGDAFVEANLAEAKKQLNAATKKKPKMGTSMSKYNKEKRDYEGKVQAAQQVVDYWDGVKQARDQRAGEELRRRADEEARRQDEERNRQEQARLEEQRRQEEEQRKQQEAEELGSHTVGKEIRDRWTGAPKVEGNADELTLADGTRIAGRYVLVESGAATPSHNAGGGFVKNAGFPVDENGGTVNDRDYERDTRAQAITREMGRTYDGRALQSVPVVSRDGVVLSGNGRTMAGEIAAADGTDGAYIENLSKYGGKFGFTPEQVAGMQHPRVVFVPDEALPYDAETFARFNAQEMKGQNKTETAVKLGKIVPDDVYNRVIRGINGFESISDFFSDDKATAEVVNELRGAGVINEMQYGEMFDGGRLSGTGRELIENVLIGKAFEGNPDAVRMLTEYPAMRQKAVSALTAIGNNRRLGGDYTLEHEIGQAIELAYRALKSGAYKHGDKVSDFARQQNLFEFDEGSTVADYQNMMVMLLADVLNGKEVNKLRNVLELYNAHAAESAAGQTDMFSGGAVRSKEEILNDVFNLLGYGTRKEIEQQRSGARETVRAKLDGASPSGQVSGGEGAKPSGTAGAVGSGSGSEGGLTLTGDEGSASPAIDAGHEAPPTSAVENQTGSATQGGTEPEQQSAEKGYTVEQTTYTNKKGKTSDVWLVKFDGELTKEQLSAGKELAKEPLPGRKTSKGWWDAKRGGFLMRSEEAANEIGEKLGNAEAVKDAQPLGLKDMQEASGGDGAATLLQHGKQLSAAQHSAAETEKEASAAATETGTASEETTDRASDSGEKTKSKWVDDEDADRFEELRQRLRKKMGGQMNMGVDPEIFAIGAEMAYYMIKHGLHKFADFAREMIDAVGDEIRPYLKSLYEGARNFPETEEYLDKMTPYDEVREFDVKNFDKKGAKDIVGTAEHVVLEEQAAKGAETAEAKLKERRNAERREKEAAVRARAAHFADETPEESAAFDREIGSMSDDELLLYMREEGHDENKAFHPNVYDEYDYRHTAEMLEYYDMYEKALSENGENRDKVGEMLASAEKAWADGGWCDGDMRTRLLAQIYTCNDWLAGDEARREKEPVMTDRQGNPVDGEGRFLLDRIGTVDELTDDDFMSPSRSVELPQIPDNVDAAIGASGKPVIIKKNIFEKNARDHKDLTPEQSREILKAALYTPDLYGQNQKASRPYNYVVISTKDAEGKNRLVLLEVNNGKENVEIVHWHYIRDNALETLKRQAEREGGHILILPSDPSEEGGGLSARTLGLSSAGKDSENIFSDQINGEEKAESDDQTAVRTGDNEAPVEPAPAEKAVDDNVNNGSNVIDGSNGNDRKGGGKGKTGKIEDVGEVIAGARKDLSRKYAQPFYEATEQTLAELPFGKAFKKPDVGKMVEDGVLRPVDAAYYQSMWLTLIDPSKPKLSKNRPTSSRQKLESWIKDTHAALERMREFVEASPDERDRMMDEALGEKFPNRDAELARIEQLKEWNKDYDRRNADGTVTHVRRSWGDRTTPNPLWVTMEVMRGLGAEAGDKVDLPGRRLVAASDGTRYYIEDEKGHNILGFASLTVEDGIEAMVYLAKLKRGDTDLHHPVSMFAPYAQRRVTHETGRWIVRWITSGTRPRSRHSRRRKMQSCSTRRSLARWQFLRSPTVKPLTIRYSLWTLSRASL